MNTDTIGLINDSARSGALIAHRNPPCRLRRMNPSDETALEDVFNSMSASSRYLRYSCAAPRLSGYMRHALLDIDDEHHFAVVAEVATGRGWQAVGIARFVATGETKGEIAVEVVDAWQRCGVGRLLLRQLRECALKLGYAQFHAHVMPSNTAAKALARRVFPDGTITCHANSSVPEADVPSPALSDSATGNATTIADATHSLATRPQALLTRAVGRVVRETAERALGLLLAP